MQLGKKTLVAVYSRKLIGLIDCDCLPVVYRLKKKTTTKNKVVSMQSCQGHRRTKTTTESGSYKGQSVCLLLACLQAECGQDSPVRPVPRRGGVGGRVGTEGERERGERRAGLAGCGLKWQQIALDHSNPFNSTGKLQLVARRSHMEWRRFQSRESTNQTAGKSGCCCDSFPEQKKERERNHNTAT